MNEQIRNLAQQAIDLERSNPEEARTIFLEAAELCITQSKLCSSNEERKKYLDLAAQLYHRSEALTNTQISQKGAFAEKLNSMRIKKTKLRFKDIGGLKELKSDIQMKIIEPFKHPEVFKHFGKKIGGGILMYGPPGCGKSLIAEATAGEADATFFNVKASDLKSKYVGETEQNIAALFEIARKEQPTIIFFDEFEALAGDRSSAAPHDRIAVSQLLTEMDGVGNKDQHILLIAATNVPWQIDIALRREGRFGTTIFVPPPDLIARQSIVEMKMRNRPIDPISFINIAKLTKGFSGADLTSLCESATDIPLKEFLHTQKLRKISEEDFARSLERLHPSAKEWYAMAFRELQKNNSDQFMEPIAKSYKNLFAPGAQICA